MYSFLDVSTPNSGLGTPLRGGGEIINANFRKLNFWMESRANIAAYSIPTLAAGGPRTLMADEFSAGNPMPLSVYERFSGPPADTTNPAYVQSVDGQWWRLKPQNGAVWLEQFGGKADYQPNLVGVTDNYPFIVKAIEFVSRTWTAVAKHSYRIELDYGDYWFSQMLERHITGHIKGQCTPGGVAPYATNWFCPSTQTCILIGQNNTVGEGGTGLNTGQGNGSTIEGIGFQHRYAAGLSFGPMTNWDPLNPKPGTGIHGRTTCTVIGCSFTLISGHGIYIHGGSGAGGAREGNANEFKVRDCEVHSCGGDGLRTIDLDANAASIVGFTTRTCGGCGIHSENSFVNTWTGIHIAGYGNWVVRFNGHLWQLIGGAGSSTNGATVTPGTNELIWYDLGSDLLPGSPHVFDWSTSLDYTLYRLPIWDSGGANVYTGPYVENSVAIAHVPGGSMIVGGTLAATRMSNFFSASGFTGRGGFSANQFLYPGTPAQAKFGDFPTVRLGGDNNINGMASNGGLSLLEWKFINATAPGGSEQWQFSYFLNRIAMKSAWGNAFSLGTVWGTDTYGRSSPDGNKGRMTIYDPVIADPNTEDGRRLGSRITRPGAGDIGTSGEQARGDFFFTTLPADFGALGWSCISPGTPGTFGTVPVFGITSVNPQNNGECVLENTSNTQAKLKYRGSDGVVRSITFTLS